MKKKQRSIFLYLVGLEHCLTQNYFVKSQNGRNGIFFLQWCHFRINHSACVLTVIPESGILITGQIMLRNSRILSTFFSPHIRNETVEPATAMDPPQRITRMLQPTKQSSTVVIGGCVWALKSRIGRAKQAGSAAQQSFFVHPIPCLKIQSPWGPYTRHSQSFGCERTPHPLHICNPAPCK